MSLNKEQNQTASLQTFAAYSKVKWRNNGLHNKPMMVIRYDIDEYGIHIVHVWDYLNRPANYIAVWAGDLIAC